MPALTTFPPVESGAYVRHFYGVPARKDMRVKVDGRPGRIVGFVDAHIVVLFDGAEHPMPAHPTWHVQYEATP